MDVDIKREFRRMISTLENEVLMPMIRDIQQGRTPQPILQFAYQHNLSETDIEYLKKLVILEGMARGLVVAQSLPEKENLPPQPEVIIAEEIEKESKGKVKYPIEKRRQIIEILYNYLKDNVTGGLNMQLIKRLSDRWDIDLLGLLKNWQYASDSVFERLKNAIINEKYLTYTNQSAIPYYLIEALELIFSL